MADGPGMRKSEMTRLEPGPERGWEGTCLGLVLGQKFPGGELRPGRPPGGRESMPHSPSLLCLPSVGS